MLQKIKKRKYTEEKATATGETSEYYLLLLFLHRRQCTFANDNDRIYKCKCLKFRNSNDEIAQMQLPLKWNGCAPMAQLTLTNWT